MKKMMKTVIAVAAGAVAAFILLYMFLLIRTYIL